jgi:hypothetical protein
MKTLKVDKRRSYRILTVLAVFQPGGAHHQGPRQALHVDHGAGDENFYNKCSKNYGVGGLEVRIYVMRRCQFMSEEGKRMQEWLKENPQRCGRRRFGLPAHLTKAFWTYLCGASLSYCPMQSLEIKSRTSSRG